MEKAIVWFRDDLRIRQHFALTHASENSGGVIPVYILAEGASTQRPGAAARYWLHGSLQSLQQDIQKAGGALLLLKAQNRVSALLDIQKKTGATQIWLHAVSDPDGRKEEELLQQKALALGVKCHIVMGNYLIDLANFRCYQVFTPFWNAACKHLIQNPPPLFQSPVRWAANPQLGISLNELDLLPKFKWYEGFSISGEPGEMSAQKRWEFFVKNQFENYAILRDYPAEKGSSKLSIALRFGEISPSQIWNEAIRVHGEKAYPFLRQILWREFAHLWLYHQPNLLSEPFRKIFSNYPWQWNHIHLKDWKKGNTGIPMIDAGMRELWGTGIMHNRVRMLVGSFLTKNMGVHWLLGARWFHETLLDADVANNIFGWQWIAGCGADGSPFFRIFNPLTQGKRFDPQSIYVKKWIPEAKDSAMPWKLPILSLEQTRNLSLENYSAMQGRKRQ